ncbi:MAG: DUF4440 domain-containing protein [Pseudomonadota bacterium]
MALIDEIRAAGDGLAAAIYAGDAAAAAACYTPDAVLLPPGAPSATGTEAIAAYWAAGIAGGLGDVRLIPGEVAETPDGATEVGVVTANAGTGKYIVLWQKTAEGWKLHRDIFNFDG